jgi:hypothetical protein
MKNIVAFSLWGDHPMYWIGALKNIELVSKFYPGFIVRFYVDKKANPILIESLKGDNVELILVDSKDSFHGMFWRFWASEDSDVDIFLSRDCDSRISEREVMAVNEWLNSDKDFHVMRDHPYHTVPILGGMWGCRNGLMREINLIESIESWNQFQRKGIDQDFLGQYVYPLVYKKTFEHSEFDLKFLNDVNKFPSTRIDYEFVGDVFDENDIRHPEYWKIIKKNK